MFLKLQNQVALNKLFIWNKTGQLSKAFSNRKWIVANFVFNTFILNFRALLLPILYVFKHSFTFYISTWYDSVRESSI